MQKEFIVFKLSNWLSLRGLYPVTRGTVTNRDFQSAIDDKDFYMLHPWSDTLHATWCQSSHSTRLTDLELDTHTKSGRTVWSHEDIGNWWWWPVPKLHGGSFSLWILIFLTSGFFKDYRGLVENGPNAIDQKHTPLSLVWACTSGGLF